MKKILMGLTAIIGLSFSTNAFAVSDEELMSACLEAGKEKLSTQAQILRCKMDLNEVEVSAIDNRWYNPSKFVWYVVTMECPESTSEVEKMVQYYAGKCL